MTSPPHALDPVSEAAIGALSLSGRPLVIVDVDEVVVHLVKPLIPWLAARGLRLDLASYNLGGNIKEIATDRAIPKEDVQELIQTFFDDQIHAQETVDNAAAVLGRLERTREVVLLTNAPHRHRQTRAASLVAQGVTATLITNEGPKGPPVRLLRERALAAGGDGSVVFIDDSTQNLENVRAHVPDVRLIHFIAHPEFRKLARDVAGVSLKTGDWLAVERFVMGVG